MAMAKSAVIFWSLMMMIALCGGSMAAVHKVGGDSAGWTAQADHVDYTKWASTNNFRVGDTLLFAYNGQFHNVLQVTKQDFQSCNATSPIATYTTGSDSVKLNRPGNFYFLCGFPGHCLAGQKVHIKVTVASASPSPAPSASAPSLSPSAVTEPTPTSNAPVLHSSRIWSAVTVIAVLLVTGFAY